MSPFHSLIERPSVSVVGIDFKPGLVPVSLLRARAEFWRNMFSQFLIFVLQIQFRAYNPIKIPSWIPNSSSYDLNVSVVATTSYDRIVFSGEDLSLKIINSMPVNTTNSSTTLFKQNCFSSTPLPPCPFIKSTTRVVVHFLRDQPLRSFVRLGRLNQPFSGPSLFAVPSLIL